MFHCSAVCCNLLRGIAMSWMLLTYTYCLIALAASVTISHRRCAIACAVVRCHTNHHDAYFRDVLWRAASRCDSDML